MAVGEGDRRLDPLPAFRLDGDDFVVEALGDQPIQQDGVLQPAAIVALEEVAHDQAAGVLIGWADELSAPVGGAHRAFGQQPADLMGLLGMGASEGLEDLFLAFVVGIDGEGHQLVEGEAVVGVDVEQASRDRGQAQALPDDRGRDEEGRGDLLLGLALLAQGLEGAKLVQRVQGRTLDVLGQAVFLREAILADHAGDGRGLGEALLLDQPLERPVAPPAGRDLEHPGVDAISVADRSHGQALQQGAPGDVLGEFLDRDAGLDPADIGLAQHQLVEGDVPRAREDDFLHLGHGRSP